ncbi:hypothetical protein HT576_00605 [Haloterrigena sp. SYSU A121-1]|uniref:Sterol desaturase n=1 Tax=Haloterrigena gelatinilytica TaxID=2741724 RepID=A0A8J8KCW5_9EURY|nr:hypothetical protein [Haloterrigena gelatinilytica]NUB89533.1 hypothetical protein [Haloterrigena gelatinilytica]
MIDSRTWLPAIALGLATSGGVYWLAGVPLLAAYVGAFWAIGVGLTAYHADAIPGLLRGNSEWGTTARLWSGAFGGLLALATTAVMGPQLPVSSETGFALGLLVIGVAVTMANVGIGLALSLAGDGAGTVETRVEAPGNDS